MPQLKKGEILEVVATVRSRSIIFHWMRVITAIRAGYSARRADHSLFNSEVIPIPAVAHSGNIVTSVSHRFYPPLSYSFQYDLRRLLCVDALPIPNA